jgi:hypothetical protein
LFVWLGGAAHHARYATFAVINPVFFLIVSISSHLPKILFPAGASFFLHYAPIFAREQ